MASFYSSAPSWRRRAAGQGGRGGTMADDPYARIAELEAENAALREREAALMPSRSEVRSTC